MVFSGVNSSSKTTGTEVLAAGDGHGVALSLCPDDGEGEYTTPYISERASRVVLDGRGSWVVLFCGV